MVLTCRYYSEKYPDMEEALMVSVRRIAEMGAYVTLVEYNNIEGMILLSELSRRRIRSVNKLIRVGRSECVVVIRVDKDKGYIDLSKRRVYAKDSIQCEERYSKAKAVNSILRHVAEQLHYETDAQLEELYRKTAWHFDDKMKKKAHSYEVFKKAISDPTVFDECDISDEIKAHLIGEIVKKLTPQAVKIRSDIEVSCFAYEGVEAVKAALIEGKKLSDAQFNIEINLIAAPSFVVTCQTMDKEEGLAAINRCLDAIKTKIEEFKGAFKLVMAPKVVTDYDEEAIKKKLEEMELNSDEEEEEDVDDDGLVASAALDKAADAEEARVKKLAKKNAVAAEDSD
uniref:Eukaryotic translation initiation factor 2 subunit 1 n=1 Tax=Rhabditophanes sp. KR3021 TaxID=114890 RepID=A0AC35TRI5_9BILA